MSQTFSTWDEYDAEVKRRNEAVLAWSKANPGKNLYGTVLTRFAACIMVCLRSGDQQWVFASEERVIHVEALDKDQALAKIRAVMLATYPEAAEDVDICNLYDENEYPDFVLRCITKTGPKGESVNPEISLVTFSKRPPLDIAGPVVRTPPPHSANRVTVPGEECAV